jgi:uncharacterized protein YjcR
MSERPANLVALTRQGAPTPQETKDEAFRLWIALARSWTRVSEQTGIPVRTLHSWGESEQWEQRRIDAAASFLPGMGTETAIALRMSSHYASIRLQQIMYDAAENGTKPDTKEVQALSLAIDRGGHSPVGNKSAPEIKLTPAETDHVYTTEELMKLPTDELMRLEQQYREKKR